MASNASELISSYNLALKKTKKTITISYSTLLGAAVMNATFCLAIFLALVYFQGLVWTFTAETLSIILVTIVMVSLECPLGPHLRGLWPNQRPTNDLTITITFATSTLQIVHDVPQGHTHIVRCNGRLRAVPTLNCLRLRDGECGKIELVGQQLKKLCLIYSSLGFFAGWPSSVAPLSPVSSSARAKVPL